VTVVPAAMVTARKAVDPAGTETVALATKVTAPVTKAPASPASKTKRTKAASPTFSKIRLKS